MSLEIAVDSANVRRAMPPGIVRESVSGITSYLSSFEELIIIFLAGRLIVHSHIPLVDHLPNRSHHDKYDHWLLVAMIQAIDHVGSGGRVVDAGDPVSNSDFVDRKESVPSGDESSCFDPIDSQDSSV